MSIAAEIVFAVLLAMIWATLDDVAKAIRNRQ